MKDQMTKSNKRKMQYIIVMGWDKTKVKIPIGVNSYWFKSSRQNQCVVGCNNIVEVYHISEKGYANIGYCNAHAELRIFHQILLGYNERGVWCYVKNAKLNPYPLYKELIESARESMNDKDYRSKLLVISTKIQNFKRSHK